MYSDNGGRWHVETPTTPPQVKYTILKFSAKRKKAAANATMAVTVAKRQCGAYVGHLNRTLTLHFSKHICPSSPQVQNVTTRV